MDVRLVPDLHDKTAEQMLAELIVSGRTVGVTGDSNGWRVSSNIWRGVTAHAGSLYEATLEVYEAVFPPPPPD